MVIKDSKYRGIINLSINQYNLLQTNSFLKYLLIDSGSNVNKMNMEFHAILQHICKLWAGVT